MAAIRTVPLFKLFMAETVATAVARTLHSGYIGEGPKVVEFERALAAYLGTSIVNLGARIVWADVDPLTGGIDPAEVGPKITKRTRAIAATRGIRVVEDNAHGWGSRYRSKPIGGESDFTRLFAPGDQARQRRRRRSGAGVSTAETRILAPATGVMRVSRR